MISARQTLFVCFFVMSFTQGIFTMLLGVLFHLVRNRPRSKGKQAYWGLAVVMLLYFLTFTHFIMVFYQDYKLFVGSGWPNMKAYAIFGMTQITIEHIGCILADILLVWRMWVLYNRSMVAIIVPSILVLTFALTVFVYAGTAFRLYSNVSGDNPQDIWKISYQNPLWGWNTAVIVSSTTTNVVLSSLIALKFIQHHRTMKSAQGFSTLVYESMVIIESGAIYAIAWIVRLVLFFMNHNAGGIVLDLIGQLAVSPSITVVNPKHRPDYNTSNAQGIVPTLIIVTITAGYSPISKPDYTSRLVMATGEKAPKGYTDTEMDIESRFSVALNPDFTTTPTPSMFASQSISSGVNSDADQKQVDVAVVDSKGTVDMR
ncbi:hypothetical protein HGRIS_012207 [Hohenbuehelia grisea]|uniref:Uncharacterized protein n=1 Tax=Hohenbuehelia grisea TaxID=104357 RepID=A0ABR3IRP9_9AGAR